jgi:hypothetical protein
MMSLLRHAAFFLAALLRHFWELALVSQGEAGVEGVSTISHDVIVTSWRAADALSSISWLRNCDSAY